ncbi:MAG: MerR family transcriptional regulator [Erysipelotrichales bacterium]|nr:MerR family transcriptional regulator [Erysipelotrichales bacterium]
MKKKKKIIPENFMTVGQLAKKMRTTVRTLQYYDKEGLLSPTAESEGGRRLYTHKDMIKLHQIQSLKSLGFSLDDIKNKLISLDTPKDVVDILNEQSLAIQQKIQQLTETVTAIEALKTEVLQMQVVDFKKYADIIVNFQMNNEYYWLIKHFDDATLDYIRTQFNKESGMDFIERFNQLNDSVMKLKEKNVDQKDKQVQALAKEFWDMVMEFTNGDMSMLPTLTNLMEDNNEWVEKQKIVNEYLQPALELYFLNTGINTDEEV